MHSIYIDKFQKQSDKTWNIPYTSNKVKKVFIICCNYYTI